MKTNKILSLWLMLFSLGMVSAIGQSQANDGSVIINEQVRDLPLDYLEEQTQVFRVAVNEQSEIIVQGENHDIEPRIVILRFDDDKSFGYNTRLNIERVVVPGAFTIQIPLFGLKTPHGRVFDWTTWKRLIIFIDKPERQVTAGTISISTAANFSQRSFGFDLGTSTSPVMTGMTQITEEYPGLVGQFLNDRHFASGNALTSDGIEGIESLTVPVPNGSYDVTLWFTMQGQWENLPRQLNQHILVQGQSALSNDWTALEWLETHYLMAEGNEAWLQGSPWQIFGDNAYQRATTVADVTDGKLVITMNGRTTHDNYLAGIFVTPTDMAGADTELLQQALQTRFEQKWQVVNRPEQQSALKKMSVVKLNQVLFDRKWQPDVELVANRAPVVVAKSSFVVLDFAAVGTSAKEQVKIELNLFNDLGQELNLGEQLRQGVWRYQRPQGSSTLLLLSADELRTIGSKSTIQLDPHLARRINLWLPIDDKFIGKSIKGELNLMQQNNVIATETFTVRVIDMVLPQVRQNVGIYHEKPVHWSWFNQLSNYAQSNLACDYDLMEKLGLTALSPPLTTPTRIYEDSTNEQVRDSVLSYIRDLNLYHQYFDSPAVDYTTVKRFEQYYRYKPELHQRHLSALALAINEQQLPMPQFAIADEVDALNSEQLSEFSAQIALLQNAMPSARFLGQLNKPQNLQLTPMMDTLLINYGFGVSQKNISRLQSQGKSVWMYNMQRKRLAAGFYLWQSKAQGYLQWHGRMPTGQPFNPLDGREADFQMFYPSLNQCDVQPHINAELLAIAEGVIDRQWLLWLTQQARTNAKAKKLLARLRHQIPTDWQDVVVLDDATVHQWRQQITALAYQLNQ